MRPISVKNRDAGNCRGERVDVIWSHTDHRGSEKKRGEHRTEKGAGEPKRKTI